MTTQTPVKLDTYQKLLVDRIDTYGTGDWKNNVSIHHKHDSSMFSNILIGREVVAKVVYEVPSEDISADDYRAIHIDKTKKAKVSYIAFGNDIWAYRSPTQVSRYRNILKKLGYLIIQVDNKVIQY
tara:strand:- start:1959 stop:2336 length:378 start_codon:yes stop_codon:yes gene_type:complete